MSIGIIYLYELFPVQVTALALSVAQTAMCLANIIMPYVLLLLTNANFPTMTIFCVLAIVFMLVICPMPETLGAEPVELIEENNPFEDDDVK